ncbi:MAG: FecR family protein [Lentisphaeraceae bacterium]|nr:FecR family protein [Lentisphaeraceae bacterium]
MKKIIQRYLENDYSEDDEKLLLEAVEKDQNMSEEIFSQMQMDESLNVYFSENNELAVNSIMNEVEKTHSVDLVMKRVKSIAKAKSRNRFVFSLAACAALLLCGFLIPYYLNSNVDLKQQDRSISEKYIHVSPGEVAVKQLENGVVLSFTGPAKYRVVNSMLVKLEKGLLISSVPKSGKGFTVSTPEGLIRDISTEFSTYVEFGKTNLKVLKGEVEVRLHHETDFVKVTETEQVSIFKRTISREGHFTQKGNIISINFGGFAQVTEETGASPAGNWNNVVAPLSPVPLEDNNGFPLQTTVHVSNSSVWKANYVEGSFPSSNLFLGRLKGGLFKSQNKSVKPLEISINSIPFKQYDVLVYYWQGRDDDKHIFTLQANDGETFNIERHNTKSTVTEHVFSPWQGEGENRSGNYFIFKELTGKDLIIRAGTPKRTDVHREWHICGIQVISRD